MRIGRFGIFSLTVAAYGFAACASAQAEAPASTDALAQRIKDYQAAKDCDGMISLFYEAGSDAKRHQDMSDTIRDYVCDNFKHKIASVAFHSLPEKVKTPDDYNGTHSVYTLKPEGVAVIDYGEGKPGDARSVSFLYGEHDHKFYLITTKKADAK